MPSRSELVAHDRTTPEIARAIGADLVIFQSLPDLISAVRQFNPSIKTFDCSVFTGEYITGGVDEEYLDNLERIRSENTKWKNSSTAGTNTPDMNGMNGYKGVNLHDSAALTNGQGGMTNGADDTVGLHNSWIATSEKELSSRALVS
jgi:amidophosphoribosyltransferase